MKRYWLALTIVAAAACIDVSGGGQPFLVLSPILDSLFVGDMLLARSVVLIDEAGLARSPGPVTWSINPPSVATIDPTTGKVVGVSKGVARISANAGNAATGVALVAVSRALEMTLLMDTVVMMPPDSTLFLREFVAIKQKTFADTTLWFDPSPTPSVYTVDTATGRVTAHGSGGPVRYVARLANSTDTIADTGVVVVLSLADTSETGKFSMTAFGTGIRHQTGGAFALHYPRRDGKLAFRLDDTVSNATTQEHVLITLADSVLAAGTFELDSISPQEAATPIFTLDPVCSPKRPWAAWASIPIDPQFRSAFSIFAYSHGRTPTDSVAGALIVTQYVPVGGGAIISGRYLFLAQRTDLYGDPLGLETIRGTFVAPLRQRNICQG
jgi:Big-like domain-containing protein